jgi:hypothetical protein
VRDRLGHEVVDPVPNPVGRHDRSFSPIEVNAAARRPPRRLGVLARVVRPPRQMSSTAPSSSVTVTGPMTSSI